MINRLNSTAQDENPAYFVKFTPQERLETAVDEAHSEMVTYRALPELSTERRAHFNAFLRRMEELHAAAKDCQARYPMAHSNRVTRGGK